MGILIDLSKAFDTVDHSIVLKQLEHYQIKRKNLYYLQSYLSNCKQCINYKKDNKTGNIGLSNIICGVSQGSIPGPLFFIIYVNDLCQASEYLKPIMFAEDRNLFYKIRLFFWKQISSSKKFQNGFKQKNYL